MKEIRTQIHNDNQYEAYLKDSDLILDLTASGRYWRTSRIQSLSVITVDKQGDFVLRVLNSEKESDEYEILVKAAEWIGEARKVITFNGHSFDLPHLHRKYAAYGLTDPLGVKDYPDLFLILKPFTRLFGLSGRKLNDYALWLDPSVNMNENDALKTLKILPLMSYVDALKAGMAKETSSVLTLKTVNAAPHSIVYTVETPFLFPRDTCVPDNYYNLSFRDHELIFTVPVEDQRIRIYHSDIENYEYLPDEGYAIHKSMAHFMDRSKRQKATRETCFHYTAYIDSLLTDSPAFRTVLASVCAFCFE